MLERCASVCHTGGDKVAQVGVKSVDIKFSAGFSRMVEKRLLPQLSRALAVLGVNTTGYP